MPYINRFAIFSMVLLSFLLLSPAQAASACKGLTKSSCAAKPSCTWVDSYKRKDGKTVKAYCRSVSKKKSSDSKSTKSGSSTKKSTKDTNKASDKKKPKKDDKKSKKDNKKPKKDTKKQPKKDNKKSS